jgi:hypothetical protein
VDYDIKISFLICFLTLRKQPISIARNEGARAGLALATNDSSAQRIGAIESPPQLPTPRLMLPLSPHRRDQAVPAHRVEGL